MYFFVFNLGLRLQTRGDRGNGNREDLKEGFWIRDSVRAGLWKERKGFGWVLWGLCKEGKEFGRGTGPPR